MALQMAGFADCCGINVVHGFGKRSESDRADPGIPVAREHLRRLQQSPSVGAYLIALNHYQVKHYAPLMEEMGYKVLMKDFYHPGHGHCITLYGLAHHGEGQKPDEAPVRGPKSIFGGRAYSW